MHNHLMQAYFTYDFFFLHLGISKHFFNVVSLNSQISYETQTNFSPVSYHTVFKFAYTKCGSHEFLIVFPQKTKTIE